MIFLIRLYNILLINNDYCDYHYDLPNILYTFCSFDDVPSFNLCLKCLIALADSTLECHMECSHSYTFDYLLLLFISYIIKHLFIQFLSSICILNSLRRITEHHASLQLFQQWFSVIHRMDPQRNFLHKQMGYLSLLVYLLMTQFSQLKS